MYGASYMKGTVLKMHSHLTCDWVKKILRSVNFFPIKWKPISKLHNSNRSIMVKIINVR